MIDSGHDDALMALADAAEESGDESAAALLRSVSIGTLPDISSRTDYRSPAIVRVLTELGAYYYCRHAGGRNSPLSHPVVSAAIRELIALSKA